MELKSLDDVYYADVDEVNGLPGRFDYVPEPERDPLATGDLGVDTSSDMGFMDFQTEFAKSVGEFLRGGVKGGLDIGQDIESIGRGIYAGLNPQEGESFIEAFGRGMQEETVVPGADRMAQAVGLDEFPHVSEQEAVQTMMGGLGEITGFGGTGTAFVKGATKLAKADWANIVEGLKPYQAAEKLFSAADEQQQMESAGRVLFPILEDRGIDAITAQLDDAVAQGVISDDSANVAKFLANKNPEFVRDLKVEVAEPTANVLQTGTTGEYLPFEEIVRLFKNPDAVQSGRTATHEIMHHAEKMLPPEIRANIKELWRNETIRTLKKLGAGKPGREEADNLLMKTIASHEGYVELTPEDKAQLVKFLDEGVYSEDMYALTSPSEFWAVNGAKIMEGKYKAEGSWIGQAKEYMKELFQGIKEALKLSNTNQVYKGLQQVFKGEHIDTGTTLKRTRDTKKVLLDKELSKKESLKKTQDQIVQGDLP